MLTLSRYTNEPAGEVKADQTKHGIVDVCLDMTSICVEVIQEE
jgi:hypothetical protein